MPQQFALQHQRELAQQDGVDFVGRPGLRIEHAEHANAFARRGLDRVPGIAWRSATAPSAVPNVGIDRTGCVPATKIRAESEDPWSRIRRIARCPLYYPAARHWRQCEAAEPQRLRLPIHEHKHPGV